MKTALITGITGQDGAYLAKFLLEKKYKVSGLYRRASSPSFWRLLSLGVYDKIKLIPGDIADMASIIKAHEKLGWKSKTKFKKLVELMLDEDLRRWKSHIAGEIFPWDAINDPNVY